MTGEAKKTESGMTSVGLLWSAAQNRGQAVLLQEGPKGIRCLGREAITGFEQLTKRLRPLTETQEDGQPSISMLVGLDSSQVGFYVFDVPSVQEPQLTSIVRTQAEGYLPLPVSGMRLAWRVDPGQPADRCILAAVRSEVYQQSMSRFSRAVIQSITPDVVGLVACWHDCFQSSRQKTVVLRIAADEAVAVLTEYGRILNAVRVDVDPEGPAQLLVGDLLQALHSLGPEIRQTDLFLLSTGSAGHAELLEELGKEGFHVHVSDLDREKLVQLQDPDPSVIEACPEAFGLALLGLRRQSVDFDFTRQKLGPELTGRQQVFSASVLRAVLSMILAVVIGVIGLYWKDKVELSSLQRQLSQEEEGQTAQRLLQQMEYRRQVAQTRPDLLALLDIIRQVMPEEMLLDQVLFERGKPVELRGVAVSYEQTYEFQKNLQQRGDIRQVQLVEPTFDEKSKKVNFTIRFAYRNFSG